MAVAVECGCGKLLQAKEVEELLKKVDRHVRRAHPKLVGTLSPLELAGRKAAAPAAA
jgi:hypothetical protein